jgi:lipid-binding SYLF domain-containing protein
MTRSIVFALLSIFTLIGIGCSDDARPPTEAKRQALSSNARTALDRMKEKDPTLNDFLANNSYGYAIFPHVDKGGLIAGGAFGRGEVYEQGRMVGYAEIQQASIGAQAGGQVFDELIIFKDKETMDRFKNNKLTFEANASAVGLESGKAKNAQFEKGIAVFVMPVKGAMLEASVGGQRFVFTEATSAETSTATTRPSQRTSEVEVHTK